MKRMLSVLLAINLLLCCCLIANADEIPTPPANQISSNPNSATDSKTFAIQQPGDGAQGTGQDGLQLTYISSSISKASSSSVTVSITTSANLTCQDIGATVYVQRWIDNQWKTYKTVGIWKYGVSSCSDSRTISVASGYYYRVKATHVAGTAYSTKSGYTTTTSILVN